MSYLEERRNQKLFGKPKEEKKIYRIPAKSQKRIKREAEEKALVGPDEDSAMEIWHKERRKERTGTCQCGCGQPTVCKNKKDDDKYFRHNNAHIYPKAEFESIKLHPKNNVERAFWGGCHTNMDSRGMEYWPSMADWDDIKEKVKILEPLLTKEERSKKFNTLLMELIKNN